MPMGDPDQRDPCVGLHNVDAITHQPRLVCSGNANLA